ncbi:MAG: DUF4058 family protein [Chthoniobacteraceae bacterium]
MIATNPFPGMNPFIEQNWSDAHVEIIAAVRSALNAELPEDLVATVEQQVSLIKPAPDKGRVTRPDVAVVDITESWKRGLPPVWTPSADANALAVTEPELMVVEELPRRWVEVRVARDELVTVIEMISPANKTTHREAYRTKVRDYVAAGVNVVEIDLLRGGQHIVDVDKEACEFRYENLGEHYLICASRGVVPDRREIYPCRLRERLPVIRIPLRATDHDVPLDIQTLVDRCYVNGRYARLLDYERPLAPPPAAEDAAWIDARLKDAGFRA